MKRNCVRALAPATCGEYIQGIYKGLPCLISSPVEVFSETVVSAGSGKSNLKEKAKTAVECLLKKHGYETSILETIDIKTDSPVPVGIGMASSTSDMVSAVAAVAAYFGITLAEEEISRICIEIEPSDNLMYKNLNLYNHYTGQIFKDYKKSLTVPITLVEFDEVVDTVEFGYETEFKKSEEDFLEVIKTFEEALLENDLEKLARATTMSARLNQEALYKEHLEEMIELAIENGGLGVLIGHSGSVLGVIEGEDFDFSRFVKALKRFLGKDVRAYETRLIPGGVRIEYRQSSKN